MAYQFSTDTDDLVWASSTDFLLSGSMAISFQIKIPSSASTALILTLEGGTGETEDENSMLYLALQGTSGSWDFSYIHEYSFGGNKQHSFNTNIPNDTWATISIIRNIAANTVQMSMDGSVVGTYNYGSNDPTVGSTTSVPLRIGERSDGAGDGALFSLANLALWSSNSPATGFLTSMTSPPGWSPLFWRNDLIFYAPLKVDTIDLIKGKTATVSGPSLIAQPNIIPPRRPQIIGMSAPPLVVVPANDTLTYTGQVPVIPFPALAAPSNDTLTYTGQVPIVNVGVSISPANDTLTYTGQVPTVVATENQIVSPANDTLTYTGQQPSIFVGEYAAIEYVGIGAMTDSSVKIQVRGSEVASYCSVEYKTTAQAWGAAIRTSSILYNADLDFTANFELTGLAANTIYDYRVYIAGSLDSGSTSTFQTFPTEDTAVSFKFGISSCLAGANRPYTAFASMPDNAPRFYIAEGDNAYGDYGTPAGAFATFNDKYYQDGVTTGTDSSWNDSDLKAFWKNTPIVMLADDHEIQNDWDQGKTLRYRFGRMSLIIYQARHGFDSPDSSTGTCESGTTGTTVKDTGAFTNVEAGDSIYNIDQRKITFVDSKTSNDEIEVYDSGFFSVGDAFVVPQTYYSFKYGDVEFFTIDNLSYRSDRWDTDNSSKTLLGSRQESWLKDAVKNSTATWKIILSPCTMGGANGGDTHNWSWDGYQTAMAVLWDYWRTNEVYGITVFSGDIHGSTAWKAMGTSPSVDPHNMNHFYDFCTSPVANTNLTISQNVPDQLYFRDATSYYSIVTIDTTISNPTLKVELYAYDDSSTVLESTTIALTEANRAIVTPGADTLAYTGQVPIIVISENQAVSPANDTLTYTGQAPVILTPRVVSPANDDLAYTGQVPTVAIGWIYVRPANDTLAYTGQVPAVLTPVVIAPAQDTLTYTGQAPTILTSRVVSPPNDTLTYTGQAPTTLVSDFIVVAPANDTLAYTGQAPTISLTDYIIVSPGSVTFNYTGQVPTIVLTGLVIVSPDSADLAYTGQIPTIALTGGVSPDGAAKVVAYSWPPARVIQASRVPKVVKK